MNEHLSKTRSELHDILDKFGLKKQVEALVVKQARKMCLVEGTIGEAFIFLKYDELVRLIDDKKAQVGRALTDAELKAIFVGWIKTMRQKVKNMYKGQDSGFSGYVKPDGEVVIEKALSG